MEITKVVNPFIRRGWPNTFDNIVYFALWMKIITNKPTACASQSNVLFWFWMIFWTNVLNEYNLIKDEFD